jgi:HD-GYP domain-containing protein (c-di-GMP phosphodiesterase class II)
MNGEQISVLTNMARGLFKNNKEFILEEWLRRVREENIASRGMEFAILCKGFNSLINDFIEHLSKGDVESYYKGNILIAQSVAYNDITFEKFITAFHLFEDSYMPLLIEQQKRELVQCINVLDRLHHNTIAIICERYFEVKDNTIISLAKLIELRDDETGGHIERTRDYSVLLARELGCSRNFIEELYKASLLHDIGKVGVKDSILLKKGKLTFEEFEEVKRHTTLGAQTIDKVIGTQEIYKGYLLMARDIALYHHEKYDGRGYPEGLKSEKIPFAARILCLADAYDAIVSERPYKTALPHEEAVRRIKQDSGTHFDPEIANAFIKINEEFRKIHYENSLLLQDA